MLVQYDNDSSFTFYDPVPPPIRSLSPDLVPLTPHHHAKDFALSPEPLAGCIGDLSEQRIDLGLISVLDSPLSDPPLSPQLHHQQNVYSSGRGLLPLTGSQQSTVVRNLAPYFVSQPPEVEFAPSPASSSSSSSIACDLDSSSYPGFNMMGVQDLLLYTSTNASYDSSLDNLTVTDWVERTLSEVINF